VMVETRCIPYTLLMAGGLGQQGVGGSTATPDPGFKTTTSSSSPRALSSPTGSPLGDKAPVQREHRPRRPSSRRTTTRETRPPCRPQSGQCVGCWP